MYYISKHVLINININFTKIKVSFREGPREGREDCAVYGNEVTKHNKLQSSLDLLN